VDWLVKAPAEKWSRDELGYNVVLTRVIKFTELLKTNKVEWDLERLSKLENKDDFAFKHLERHSKAAAATNKEKPETSTKPKKDKDSKMGSPRFPDEFDASKELKEERERRRKHDPRDAKFDIEVERERKIKEMMTEREREHGREFDPKDERWKEMNERRDRRRREMEAERGVGEDRMRFDERMRDHSKKNVRNTTYRRRMEEKKKRMVKSQTNSGVNKKMRSIKNVRD